MPQSSAAGQGIRLRVSQPLHRSSTTGLPAFPQESASGSKHDASSGRMGKKQTLSRGASSRGLPPRDDKSTVGDIEIDSKEKDDLDARVLANISPEDMPGLSYRPGAMKLRTCVCSQSRFMTRERSKMLRAEKQLLSRQRWIRAHMRETLRGEDVIAQLQRDCDALEAQIREEHGDRISLLMDYRRLKTETEKHEKEYGPRREEIFSRREALRLKNEALEIERVKTEAEYEKLHSFRASLDERERLQNEEKAKIDARAAEVDALVVELEQETKLLNQEEAELEEDDVKEEQE